MMYMREPLEKISLALKLIEKQEPADDAVLLCLKGQCFQCPFKVEMANFPTELIMHVGLILLFRNMEINVFIAYKANNRRNSL